MMTAQEIEGLDWLHTDWTMKQMEELGLHQEQLDGMGETHFYNEEIRYIYLDFLDQTKPAIVDVYRDYAGPRGMAIGDTFEDVLALSPQQEDWRNAAYGVFYGRFNPDIEQERNKMSGRVSIQKEGEKEIILLTENLFPAIRIYFQDDIVSKLSFRLINGT